ncbi:MarR family winged helix-turn-helix transcriptional regulator [Microbacterium sp.]|uniref:MarR family winged helix-turn-helix transcriptional regulator n=1 Tax=Microbacterium sp. TaxID=51671 RepID=UPI00092B687E|nr:MarR family winged helix-turn-helix transcriptional regulator [Microbacterium sp.]MBN9188272.1 winged helix-turn-helix transcriptional regulator [Microbacterium sp.]MBN9192025.1 winged helix-turn-helix transcriptional regulator [Microbacterium sp.]OJU58282.1 MAG: hypothetical protein BGO04_02080 [Microbacterium sp. 70-38]
MTSERQRHASGDAELYERLTRAAALEIDPGADLDAMDFGLSVVRAGNRLQQDLEQQVHRPAGMTWAAFRVLFTIKSVGDVSPMRLAHLSNTSPASISSVLKTLDSYGMIARTVNESDKRAVRLTLTPVGEEAVAELFTRNNRRVREWAARYTEAERAQLIQLLGRLLHEPSPHPLSERERQKPVRSRRARTTK